MWQRRKRQLLTHGCCHTRQRQAHRFALHAATQKHVSKLEFKVGHAEKEGREAWLYTIRKHVFRTGAATIPLASLASFSTVVGGGAVYLLGFHIATMLEVGISLPDYPKFLATQQWVILVKAYGKLVRVTDQSVADWPFGWTVVPINLTLQTREGVATCLDSLSVRQGLVRRPLKRRTHVNEKFQLVLLAARECDTLVFQGTR